MVRCSELSATAYIGRYIFSPLLSSFHRSDQLVGLREVFKTHAPQIHSNIFIDQSVSLRWYVIKGTPNQTPMYAACRYFFRSIFFFVFCFSSFSFALVEDLFCATVHWNQARKFEDKLMGIRRMIHFPHF